MLKRFLVGFFRGGTLWPSFHHSWGGRGRSPTIFLSGLIIVISRELQTVLHYSTLINRTIMYTTGHTYSTLILVRDTCTVAMQSAMQFHTTFFRTFFFESFTSIKPGKKSKVSDFQELKLDWCRTRSKKMLLTAYFIWLIYLCERHNLRPHLKQVVSAM
jgi:hypothetical protein